MNSCVQLISRPRLAASATNGAPSIGKLDADHQAFAADFADEIKFRAELCKSGAQFFAACADIFEQFFVFDDLQKFERRRRKSSGRRQMLCHASPGEIVSSHRIGRQNRAKRQSRRQRLGDHHNVRLRCKLLVREMAPGAAQAALNLVGDQQRAVLGGQRAGAIPECFADRINAAFALNRFRADTAQTESSNFDSRSAHIVEAHKFDARHERRERQPVFFRGGNADRAKRAPVKRIRPAPESDVFAAGVHAASCGSRAHSRASFMRPIDGFRAAVAEKYAVQPRPFAPALRASGP